MNKALKLFLFATILFVTSGVANAQQYGIGRFERVQILADDLRNATRTLYLREERSWPGRRGNVYVLRNLSRLHSHAANFENQIEVNFRSRDRINLEYSRLVGTFREVQYNLDRSGVGYLYGDLRHVNNLVQQIGRNLYSYGGRYRDGMRDPGDYDYRDDYDYDDNDDYDDYDDDDDYDDYDDD